MPSSTRGTPTTTRDRTNHSFKSFHRNENSSSVSLVLLFYILFPGKYVCDPYLFAHKRTIKAFHGKHLKALTTYATMMTLTAATAMMAGANTEVGGTKSKESSITYD